MSHLATDAAGVEVIHQIYGLYRDGKDMSELFKLSSMAWKAYAMSHKCKYIMWTADQIDTLIQEFAPNWVQQLYRD